MAVAATNLVATGGVVGVSLASGSFTPTANRLVLAAVQSRTGITADPNIPTLSGNGLTWVQVATVLYDSTSSSRKRLTVFRAMGASPTTGALTADFAVQAQTDMGIVVDEFSGIDTGGTDGSTAVVQSATALDDTITVATLTATLAAFGSVNNATYGAFAIGSVSSTSTAGTGFTKIGDLGTTTNNRVTTEFRNDNDTSVDMSWSANEEIGGIGIEIKAAAVVSTATGATAMLMGV